MGRVSSTPPMLAMGLLLGAGLITFTSYPRGRVRVVARFMDKAMARHPEFPNWVHCVSTPTIYIWHVTYPGCACYFPKPLN